MTLLIDNTINKFRDILTGVLSYCRKWVERLCRLMERHGIDYWWELSTEKLIGRELRQELNNNIDDLERGTVRTKLMVSFNGISYVSNANDYIS